VTGAIAADAEKAVRRAFLFHAGHNITLALTNNFKDSPRAPTQRLQRRGRRRKTRLKQGVDEVRAKELGSLCACEDNEELLVGEMKVGIG
jgi:hypothetical protein